MFNLTELQQQRAHKALSAKEIVERAEKDEGGSRPMTPDECAIFDRLTEDIGKLDEQIAAVQAHQRRADAGRKLLEDLDKPAGRQSAPDLPAKTDPNAVKVRDNYGFTIPAKARAVGTLRAFKGQNAEQRAYRAGMWCLATLFKNEHAQHWCTTHGGIDIRAAMSTFSNPDGGFLVEDEFARTIIELREEYGVFRQNARVWQMGSDTLNIPRRTAGVTWGALGEGATITDSNPTGDTVMLVAKKSGGMVKVSSEVNADSVISLADWIAREFALGAAKFEDDSGFIGDGTSTYNGSRGLTNLFTEANGYAGGVLAAAGHDTFAEVDASDLATLMGKLPEYAAMNAKFYCSRVAAELVFGRLQAVAGGNTVGTLSGERAGRSYLGYPVVVSQVLPSATTALTDGSSMLFFGDLSKSSSLGDRGGLRVMVSEHRYFDSDQIAIRGTERVDVVNHDIGTTSVVGPIVALLANAS